MAARKISKMRDLPDNLPFHVGDIIGTGAFATYVLTQTYSVYSIVNYVFIECALLKTCIRLNSMQ
jgi:hypothetical protein